MLTIKKQTEREGRSEVRKVIGTDKKKEREKKKITT